jgi:ribosomal protein S18 acetylase RimI-like enzyme
MSTEKISTATKTDADQCVAVMSLAFSSDPAVRWMYPEPHQYVQYFPRFVRAFGGRAFEHGTAQTIGGGAALWLPPGVLPDEDSLAALIEESVPASKQAAVFAVFEQMGAFHPHEPHWHLPLIGTDPSRQRKGVGSALLRNALAVCDRRQEFAYLEATSTTSVPLYQRHGFEVLGTIQLKSSPPIFPMLRAPRKTVH